MKDTAAFRISSDLLFYFAVAVCFLMNKDVFPLLAIFSILTIAVTFGGVYIENRALRALLGLVPAVCYFFTDNLTVWIMMAFPILYLFVTFLVDRMYMEAWTYRKIFIAMAAIFFGCFLFSSLGDKKSLNIPGMIYGLLFLATGVISLRKMRMGASMNLKWNGANAAMVLLPIAGAGLVTAALYFIGMNLINILFALTKLITLIANFFRNLFPAAEKLPGEPALEPTQNAAQQVTVPLESESVIPGTTAGEQEPHIYLDPEGRWFLALGLIVLFVVAVCLIIRFIGIHKKEDGDEVLYDETERGFFRRRRRKKSNDTAPVARVRAAYREYLDIVRKKGIPVAKDDTTQEILEDSKPEVAGVSDEKLREVYLKARYGNPEDVTEADAELAEAFLKAVKEENEERF